MNIKTKLREVLLEAEKNHKTEYGCLMVYLDIDKKDWKALQDLIDEDDLYTEEAGYGLEDKPHVTILYGLHEDIEDEEIEVDINKIKEPKMRFKDISTFNPKDYDVLKFDVESSDLVKLNKEFREYPHTNSFPDYHAHATIAYVKKGTGKKYAEKMKDMLDIKIEPSKIVYSKANGEKKDYKLKK